MQKKFYIIDYTPEVKDKKNVELIYKDGKISFDNVKFKYTDTTETLKSIIGFSGKKMAALVGHSGVENLQF